MNVTNPLGIMRNWYEEASPETVVEFQPGSGYFSRDLRTNHRGFWYGVETWAPNVNKHNLWDVYDRIVLSDIRHLDFMTVTAAPDLVILNNTIQHLQPDEAEVILNKVKLWTESLIATVTFTDSGYTGDWTYLRRFDPSLEMVSDALTPGLEKVVTDEEQMIFWWNA